MKYRSLTIAAAMIVALTATSVFSGERVLSLRGENDLAALAQTFNKGVVLPWEGGFKRSWKLQPPSISHSIEKDVIDLNGNSCMSCHSEEKYKEEKAVKIGDSHFIAADGSKSDAVDRRRYFCTQCHTTQIDVDPLIENTFSSAGN